ncbi:hypothetical protein ACFQZF_12000 [Flavobacterium myungsuense]|uniref:Uncharacterized protein n=1 Tax=Flavobacterium myungsuense TaxID=651823 RepID=A0ABW3J683_9FLAO
MKTKTFTILSNAFLHNYRKCTNAITTTGKNTPDSVGKISYTIEQLTFETEKTLNGSISLRGQQTFEII